MSSNYETAIHNADSAVKSTRGGYLTTWSGQVIKNDGTPWDDSIPSPVTDRDDVPTPTLIYDMATGEGGSFNEVLNSAKSGDVIGLAPCLSNCIIRAVNGRLDINKSLTIIGIQDAGIHQDTDAARKSVMRTKLSIPGDITIGNNNEDIDVVFDGIEFTGNGSICLYKVHSITFRNCRFTNTEASIIKITGKRTDFTKLIFEHNYIYGNKTDVFDCRLFSSRINGGLINYADGSRISNNYFGEDAYYDRNKCFAFIFNGSGTLTISGNSFPNNGIVMQPLNNLNDITVNIESNTFRACDAPNAPTDSGVLHIYPSLQDNATYTNVIFNINDNNYPSDVKVTAKKYIINRAGYIYDENDPSQTDLFINGATFNIDGVATTPTLITTAPDWAPVKI